MLGLKVNYTTKQMSLAFNGHFPEKLERPNRWIVSVVLLLDLFPVEHGGKTLLTCEPELISLGVRFLCVSLFCCA